jgi:peptidoglycan/xylan/chitin deacetylase (PgdA/CDA1 family)
VRSCWKAVLALAAVAAGGFSLALPGCGGHSRLSVSVPGGSRRVAEGSTLARVASILGLRPKAGVLLDVQGHVLRAGAFPGRLLLNGHPGRGDALLHDGDRIQVVNGRDRTEKLERQVLPVPGGIPPDPQFVLARTPGVQVIVRGAVSHELVSARFEPSGGARVERAVALTFDDGPWPVTTPRILTILRRQHAPATFFVIGYLADRFPGLVARERAEGMTVGNHTYNHPQVPPFGQLPRALVRVQIALGAESIRRAGVSPRLMRPPGGSFSPTTVAVARSLGERVVLWSVDPADWRPGTTARQIVKRVLNAVRPGSIVILHDGGGDRSATVAALPAIIRGIRRKGLRLVAIPQR